MTFGNRWSIGKKLGVCFTSTSLLLLILGFYADATIARLGRSEDLAVNGLARKVELAGRLDQDAEKMRSNVRALILSTYSRDAQQADGARKDFRGATEDFTKALADTRSLIDGENEKRISANLQKSLDASIPVFEQMERLSAAEQPEAAERVNTEQFAPIARQADLATDELRDEQIADLNSEGRQAAASVQRSRWIGGILMALSLAVGGGVFFTIRVISTRLKDLGGRMSAHAEQVAGVASQVASSSQSLAQGSSEQAASLEETSSSTETINAMAHKNSEYSQRAAELVNRSDANISNANQMLDHMNTAMKEISASSRSISKINKVIDDIAFQTNILALNAAVEAARAGEAGLGFAVVADEVRNLAQRCAQAARETAALINDSLVKSTEGKSTVDRVTEAIRAITDDSAKLKSLVGDVNSGSQEQRRGIEQITQALAQMQQVTQETAAGAEESAAAGEELSAQAQGVREIIGELLGMVGSAANVDRPS